MKNIGFRVDDLLGPYPPPIRKTVERLRKMIFESAPESLEKANKGWRSISYRDPQLGYFCGIFPFEEHVDLIFEFGALLPDPEGILKGDKKQVRYLRFHAPEEIRERLIQPLIEAALSLPPDYSTRRGLLQSKKSNK